MARLVMRLGMVVIVACVALICVGMAIGVSVRGDTILFNIQDRYTLIGRIALLDVNTHLVGKLEFNDHWFEGSSILYTSDFNPTWSPDGSQIAFEHSLADFQGGISEESQFICITDAYGDNLQCLTNGRYATWAGQYLAYLYRHRMRIIDVNTNEIFNVTGHANEWSYRTPQANFSWSTQLNLIAFTWQAEEGINSEIFVVEPHGEKFRNLSNQTIPDCCPVWSPDGQRIAFGSNPIGDNQIYVMNADGSNKQLVADNTWVYYAAWSPDGTQIAYFDQSDNIFIVNADGSQARWLAQGRSPSWSPDGGRLSFISEHDGSWQIYVVSRDGSSLQRLTNLSASIVGSPPSWRP